MWKHISILLLLFTIPYFCTGDVHPLIILDDKTQRYRILAEDTSASTSNTGNGGGGKTNDPSSSSSSNANDKVPKRKKNGNFTEYKMGQAAKSLSRYEYIAIIGGIGFFLFMGAAFS